MATGRIRTLVKDRGFGFIQQDGSNAEVFFHRSSLPEGEFEGLKAEQAMQFDVEPDPKNASRQRAVNVRSAN